MNESTSMSMGRRRLLLGAAAVLATAAPLGAAWAQAAYPSRPIKLVIPYAPGGPTDVLGRIVANQLAQTLKQNIVVENQAGAGGIVAMSNVSKAAPDGYTLLLGDMNLAVGPALHKSLPYDPVKDFASIGMIATAPMLMLVPPDSQARTAEQYVAYAKAQNGKLAYASAGIGSPTHLAAEVLKSKYGLDITHVPFSGAGPALTAVASGQTSLIFTGLSGAKPLVDSGKLRALAVTGDKRAAVLPNVPTLAEAGLKIPELAVGSWWGLLAPAGLPPALAQQLNRALNESLAAPETAERLVGLNYAVAPSTVPEFSQWVAGQTRTWTAVLQTAGIVPE